MFKKILLTLFLILFVFSFSQTDTSNNQQNKKIELLNKKVDSLISEQNSVKTKILEERINQATETITNKFYKFKADYFILLLTGVFFILQL
ncbi:hypothetical protein [Chryseobacterium sp. SIMBA_028]|uniref:hypothetical protein n=1 Tax=Chryseobacterium sp. SIMBA_028 TaxID=3085771 RepID=UPI00397C658C